MFFTQQVPQWFFGYDVLIEVFFAIITLIVSMYAYKVYKLSDQKQPKFFGLGFLLISLSYFVQLTFNFVILHELSEGIKTISEMINLTILNNIAIYSRIILFIIGLLIITYITFKVKNKVAFSLLFLTTIISIVFNNEKIFMFHLLSALILLFIAYYYLMNFLSNKKKNTFIIFIAFALLFIGRIEFVLSSTNIQFYVIGHFLDLTAYILILADLILMGRMSRHKSIQDKVQK